MLRMRARVALAGVSSLALALVIAPGSLAQEPSVGALPSFTQEQLETAIVDLDPGIANLDGTLTEVAVEEGEDIILNADILFEFAKADLTDTARTRIGELIADVPQGAALTVTGHTDSIGDDASNMVLSQQRAQAVADAIAAARGDLALTVEGKGETEPVEANERGGEDNPEGRAKNRRVEISPR